MKNLKIITIILFILLSMTLRGAGESGEVFIGKIDFVSTIRCEVIVNTVSGSAVSLLSAGTVLVTSAGKSRVQLTVIKTEGQLARCSFKCGKKADIQPHEGGDVYFSANDNAASGYSDVKVLLSGLIKLYEDFILKIEATDDPVKIAVIVDEFSSSLERIIPEMDRLNKKYPELKDFMTSPPAELKNTVLLIRELEPRLNDAFFKVRMFASHPDVEKSLGRLQSVLEKINGGRN